MLSRIELNLKQQYNRLTKIIKSEIKAIQENERTKFCKTIEKTKKCTSEYWNKIKSISQLDHKDSKANKIPELRHENKIYSTNEEKSNLFGTILKNIFSETPNPKFDQQNKEFVESFIQNNKENLFYTSEENKKYDEKFSFEELELTLKHLNKKSAPGIDEINNKHLIHLSTKGKNMLLHILNLSWTKIEVLDEWKIAKIKMLKKKDDDVHDPNNYRPISLTNTIIKLLEKLVQRRLLDFLEKKKLLAKNQSGFRTNRSTIDNLIYLIQKAYEAFDDKKLMCAIIFDIMKAFDKVWHSGLIYKLSKARIPQRIGFWIVEFLKNRQFVVEVDKTLSNLFKIESGVPQGAILSPTLFLVFINDILEINNYPNDKIKSLLFADDLLSFNIDKNINRLQIQMQRYLNHLENWLAKWRMNIAGKKCSFTIYSKGKIPTNLTNNKFVLKIFNEAIPIDHNPKYLGITLDRKLNFNVHVESIRSKCLKDLNILKCLSYKKWSLDVNQQLVVYKCLIRSKMEYAPQLLRMTEKNINRLHGVQYQALKIIYKEKYDSSSRFLHDLSQIETMGTRLANLSDKYIERATLNGNELILSLMNEITFSAFEKTPLEMLGRWYN